MRTPTTFDAADAVSLGNLRYAWRPYVRTGHHVMKEDRSAQEGGYIRDIR